MFRKSLKAAAVLATSALCFYSHLAVADTHQRETALLPPVQKILTQIPQPDPNVLLQDVYVGLYAIKAPLGMDYMAIGQKAILNNFVCFGQALVAGDICNKGLYDEPNNYGAVLDWQLC